MFKEKKYFKEERLHHIISAALIIQHQACNSYLLMTKSLPSTRPAETNS